LLMLTSSCQLLVRARSSNQAKLPSTATSKDYCPVKSLDPELSSSPRICGSRQPKVRVTDSGSRIRNQYFKACPLLLVKPFPRRCFPELIGARASVTTAATMSPRKKACAQHCNPSPPILPVVREEVWAQSRSTGLLDSRDCYARRLKGSGIR
jgi:hypothetical protein